MEIDKAICRRYIFTSFFGRFSVAPQGKGTSRDYQRYMGLGLVMPAMVLIGCGLGYLADEKLGTKPWLLIVGAGVGMALGFTSFISIILRGEKRAQEKDRSNEER